MAGYIAELQGAMAAMSEDPANRSRLYLTDRELAALPCMAHDTVFAVRLHNVPKTSCVQSQRLTAPADEESCMAHGNVLAVRLCMWKCNSDLHVRNRQLQQTETSVRSTCTLFSGVWLACMTLAAQRQVHVQRFPWSVCQSDRKAWVLWA